MSARLIEDVTGINKSEVHRILNKNLKRQSAVWKSRDDSPPRKVRLQKSKVKTMLITFFDSKGMIHKEFVPEGSTVNGQYYLGVMQCLLARIRRVRSQYKAQGS